MEDDRISSTIKYELLEQMISVVENCETSIMEINYGYQDMEPEEVYLDYVKKTMLMLLEKACTEGIICSKVKFPEVYSKLDVLPVIGNGLDENVESVFENIMYAYGWENEYYLIPCLSDKAEPYDEIHQILEEEGMSSELIHTLQDEGVLEYIVDICFEGSGVLTLWKNDSLSDIIINNRMKGLTNEQQFKFECLWSKFIQMKWQDPLAHPPVFLGKDVFFCYMDGAWYNDMGVSVYSDSFNLKLHVPLYAALIEEFICNNFSG